MEFKKCFATINEEVTFNKGDVKALANILLTARCITSKHSVDYQLKTMLEEADVLIESDRLNNDFTRHPFRYITIIRKSSGKELAYISVNFKQELEPVDNGRILCSNGMKTT